MSFRYPLLVLLSFFASLPLWGAQDPPTVFPPAGYEGFPTLAADDGRFTGVSQGLNTLGTGSASFSVCVDPQGGAVTNLDLWGFDLDHGNPGNATATVASFWDLENMMFGNDDFFYHLYTDPNLSGDTSNELDINGGAAGNAIDASTLPDNDWVQVVNRPLDGAALNGAGLYCYLLVASFDTPSGNDQSNRIKLASDTSGDGLLRLLRDTIAGFVGLTDIDPVDCANPGSLPCFFPGRDTTFDGTFDFFENVDNSQGIPCSQTFWEADSDHAADTDDASSPAFPTFAAPIPPATVAEADNMGVPADNGGAGAATIGGNVALSYTGPGGNYLMNVVNPSGNLEFEKRKVASTAAACLPLPGDEDATAPSLVGTHQISWTDLDGDNQVFLLVENTFVNPLPDDECGPKKKVTELYFEYTGEDCSATDNDQGNKDFCFGDPGASPVSVFLHKKANKRTADPDSGIAVGDVVHFTTTEDWFKGDLSFWVVGDGGADFQYISLHVSCSQPLAIGDQFGSMLVVGMVTD